MTISKSRFCVPCVLLTFAVACGSAGSDRVEEQEAGQSSLEPVTASPSDVVSPEGHILWEKAFAETGKLTIYESDSGALFQSLTWDNAQASAAVDHEAAARATGEESLRGAFAALWPETSVPGLIDELDSRIAQQRMNLLEDATLLGLSAPEEAPGEFVPKSYQSFLDNVCTDHWPGSTWKWVAWGCWYQGPVSSRTTSTGYNNHSNNWAQPDRIYAQNDASTTARVRVCEVGSSCSSYGTLSAGYWGYFYWYTPLYTNNWYGQIYLTSGSGALGITIHYPVEVIH